jgi:hypothetical protein
VYSPRVSSPVLCLAIEHFRKSVGDHRSEVSRSAFDGSGLISRIGKHAQGQILHTAKLGVLFCELEVEDRKMSGKGKAQA